jgi:hypothetical protein
MMVSRRQAKAEQIGSQHVVLYPYTLRKVALPPAQIPPDKADQVNQWRRHPERIGGHHELVTCNNEAVSKNCMWPRRCE